MRDGRRSIDVPVRREAVEQDGQPDRDRRAASSRSIRRRRERSRVDRALRLVDALAQGARKTWELSIFTVKMLGRILIGDASLQEHQRSDHDGRLSRASRRRPALLVFVGYLALISISLGVLNLLPVPLLDGGHLLYYLAEIIKGSPVSDRAFEVGQRIGMAMLAVLMALALFNDVSRLF